MTPRRILPVIALSQFAGTSLWFATNAVMADLQRAAALPDAAVGWLTAAVQVGFIAGTFVFAIFVVMLAASARRARPSAKPPLGCLPTAMCTILSRDRDTATTSPATRSFPVGIWRAGR